MSAPRLPDRLLALSPGDLRDARAVEAFVHALGDACAAGLRALLVREPGLGDAAVLELAAAARERLDAAGEPGWLGVHDRPHLVAAAGAQAVHLGFRSLTPADARQQLPAELAVGFSAHEGDEDGAREGADYLLFGPVRDTPSKRGKVAAAGFDGLRRAASDEPRPLWALGGLRPEDVAPAAAAGARGVASLSGLFGAGEVGPRVEAWLRAVEAAPFP